jgi:hypothetical protein
MRTLVLAAALVALAAGCASDEAETAAPAPGVPPLSAGQERDFAAGRLAVGDVLACIVAGIRAEAKVPEPRKRAFVNSTHAWIADGRTAQLRLDVRPTGRVVALCTT